MALWQEPEDDTPLRQRTLQAIKDHYRRSGNFPQMRQIMADVGIVSTGAMCHHLNEMVRAGMVVRVGEKGSRSGCYTLPSVLRLLEGLR